MHINIHIIIHINIHRNIHINIHITILLISFSPLPILLHPYPLFSPLFFLPSLQYPASIYRSVRVRTPSHYALYHISSHVAIGRGHLLVLLFIGLVACFTENGASCLLTVDTFDLTC